MSYKIFEELCNSKGITAYAERPELKVLFRAAKNVSKEDIEAVVRLLNK